MSSTPLPTAPIEVFCSYAHEDEDLRKELEKHLSPLTREGVIASWYDRDISAGTEWAEQIDAHLNKANIILLLISPHFIVSNYCYDVELQRAMERHNAVEARVIPLILKPIDWTHLPFGKLQALPMDGKPVTTWANRDEAFLNIAEGIRKVAEEVRLGKDGQAIPQRSRSVSTPEVTVTALHQLPSPPRDFTGRHAELDELHTALDQRGLTLSGIQGMGGIGKTALALKVAEQLTPRYPDAQFYLDLKGTSAQPLTTTDVMEHIIRAYYPDAKLPDSEDQLRGLYQSVLHDQQALLFLDNAVSKEQIASLLPPPSCFVLVTSRQHFTLPGLFAKRLETLLPNEGDLGSAGSATALRRAGSFFASGLPVALPYYSL